MARQCVGALAAEIDEETMAGTQLVVSELVTNSFRHARMRAEDTIFLRVDTLPEAIHVEVVDNGKGFVPRRRTKGSPDVSEWGLYIVERIASRWGVDHKDGTRVWCDIDYRRPRRRSTACSS